MAHKSHLRGLLSIAGQTWSWLCRGEAWLILACLSSALQACALVESGIGGQGTTVRKDSSNIGDVLAVETSAEDGVLTSEPRDTTRSPTVGPSGQERTPLDGSKLDTVIPGGVSSPLDKGITGSLLGDSALRTSAVTAEQREAFSARMDGFVRLEDSLYNHILTAPFELYRVTKTSDGLEAGTLRYALQSDKSNFIVFDPAVFPSGKETSISLVNGPLLVRSGKSVLSLGGNVVLRSSSSQSALILRGQRQLSLRNLIFESSDANPPTSGTGVAPVIRLEEGASDVWIDQNLFRYCPAACISIGEGITSSKAVISVSRNDFHSVGRAIEVEDAPAVNADGTPSSRTGPSREYVKVSVYDNIFRNISGIGILVRYTAYVHAFNNYFADWSGKAIVTQSFGRVLSEANIFSKSVAGSSSQSILDEGGCSDSNWELFLNEAVAGGGACPENVFSFVEEDEPHSVEDVDGLSGNVLSEFLASLNESTESIEATLVDLGTQSE